jgi:hypothetical protein
MKNLCLIISLIGISFSPIVCAQDFNFSGVPSLSLGHIRSVERNIFSPLSNPAGVTKLKTAGFAISYISPYTIKELSNRSVTATAPTKVGYFSLLFTQSGYSLSLLNRYGFSYARTFGKVVAASLQFNGLTHKIEGADTYGGFFTTIGLQFFPSEKVDLGFYIQNPEQSKISYPDQKELIPVLYVAGLNWHPLNYLSLMVEMEKDQQFDPQYRFGIELKPVDVLTLRGGVKGSPVELSFGAGTKWRFIVVDVGMSYHQQLGVTSGISLTITLPKIPDKNVEQ